MIQYYDGLMLHVELTALNKAELQVSIESDYITVSVGAATILQIKTNGASVIKLHHQRPA